jgi:hypothetical protein
VRRQAQSIEPSPSSKEESMNPKNRRKLVLNTETLKKLQASPETNSRGEAMPTHTHPTTTATTVQTGCC